MATNGNIPTLDDKSYLLSISFSRFGNERNLGQDEYTVEDGADQDLTSATHVRLESKTLLKIVNHDSWVQKGVYRVSLANFESIIAGLEARKADRDKLVDEFEKAYPADVAATKAKLGGMAKDSDYPSAPSARAEFAMTWRIISGGVPSSLATLNPDIYHKERAAYAKHLKQVADQYAALQRAVVKAAIDKLVERLTPGPNGEKKILRTSTVANLQEVLADFPALDLANDGEMAAVVAKASALMAGFDADDLRTDEAIAAMVQVGINDIKQAVDALAVDAKVGRRRIKFSDAA
jgi:hypothetical protein